MTRTLLAAPLFAGAIGGASAALVTQEAFTSSSGFSNGVSITSTNTWNMAGNSPAWIGQNLPCSGQALNASTSDSSGVSDLGQSWSNRTIEEQ